MHTPLPWSLLLTSCLVLGLGCAHQLRPIDTGPVPEAEADSRSGADGTAKGAVALPDTQADDSELPLRVFENSGEVSWPARQRTRWRRVDLTYAPMDPDTPLRCELRYQPDSAELRIEAFNESATPLPEHHQISPGQYVTEVFLEKLAPVFLRIRAERPEDSARFTLRCSLHYKVVSERGGRGLGGRPRPRPTPAPDEPYERGLEGRIVSFERKDGQLILLLDKGTNAGVKVGQRGGVLAGKSGREPLDGGSFQVREVTESGCVVETTLRSVGKNRRVIIFTP